MYECIGCLCQATCWLCSRDAPHFSGRSVEGGPLAAVPDESQSRPWGGSSVEGGLPVPPNMALPPPDMALGRPRYAMPMGLHAQLTQLAKRHRADPSGRLFVHHLRLGAIPLKLSLQRATRPDATVRLTDMVVLFFRRHVREFSPRAGRASRGSILAPRVRDSAASRRWARSISHGRLLPEGRGLRA